MLTVSGAEEVSTADALTSALADSSIPKITLMGNIEIGDTLTVDPVSYTHLEVYKRQFVNSL